MAAIFRIAVEEFSEGFHEALQFAYYTFISDCFSSIQGFLSAPIPAIIYYFANFSYFIIFINRGYRVAIAVFSGEEVPADNYSTGAIIDIYFVYTLVFIEVRFYSNTEYIPLERFEAEAVVAGAVLIIIVVVFRSILTIYYCA
ncbi:uncharacterized protein B0T23DRAFT_391649 [Neurospora hispaniola]|uniref:Uncharacterized protein n=1 Tax=Neurospora hispaniola TaxID=588809 RepID=A0AAJ0IEL8_9PEZI|nr:hypothetical protein B0T23DRAFT_391649 [Neurospora hispaniola]